MFRIKPVYSFHLLMSMGTICFFSTMHFSYDMVSGFSICDEVALYIGFDGRVNLS